VRLNVLWAAGAVFLFPVIIFALMMFNLREQDDPEFALAFGFWLGLPGLMIALFLFWLGSSSKR